MPHDPERIGEVREWLAKALRDLGAGAHALAAEPPFGGDAAFHAQQAAEKALKAYLIWHQIPARKTHDLGEIGLLCAAHDPSLTELCQRADRLTIFAWVFRYPGEPDEPTPHEAREAILLAREVYEAITARLPAEVCS